MYRVLLPVDKQGKILVGESGMFGFGQDSKIKTLGEMNARMAQKLSMGDMQGAELAHQQIKEYAKKEGLTLQPFFKTKLIFQLKCENEA